MMRLACFAALALAILLPLAGCGGQSSQQQRTIEVVEQSGIDQAKDLLQGYADGNPVGSEADGYASVVSAVREEDAAKADILEAGLAEIAASPSGAASKAKDLLGKL